MQDRPPANSRKRQILETVLKLVAEHGAEAVSAQLIADAIGVTQPAVFRHFPTKEAIWLAVMDWLEDRLGSIHVMADHSGGEPGLLALERMFLEHVRLIEDYPALTKLVFSDHLRQQYPSVQQRFGKIHKIYASRLVELIDQAKSVGAVPHSLPTEDAATMFLCLVRGLGFQFAIAQLSERLMPEAERIFDLYLRAITAKAQQSNARHR